MTLSYKPGFILQEEPKTISQALKDASWVKAMQEELLQFKLQQVWILVDLPFGKKAIGTKWVFRNKRDERSIVVKNKAFEEEKRRIASQKKAAQATNTNQLSTDRPFVSTGKIPIDASTLPNADLPIDPNMPDLEDASDTLPNDGIFNGAYDDDEDVGVVADFNNMDNTIAVSPIPTLRIHKDRPKGQILGDPTSAVQTRGKIQKASSAQQVLVSCIHKQNRTNHKDHQKIIEIK
ncbi:hypothetical protein Tco_0792729 [Tanacetum coccineum]